MSNKEKELLLEIGESRAALKALRDLGFALADPKQKFDGPIIGQALNVVPVRILYPGDNDGVHDEGDVIGRPKDYTAYPIDQAKIIHIDKPRWMERFAAEAKLLEKGYYAAEYSSKAKGKPITYKRLELDIREQPEKAHLTFERDEGELPERLPDEEVTERPPVRFPFRKEPPLLPPHVEPPPELDLTSPKRG